jgi:hypothetical protein
MLSSRITAVFPDKGSAERAVKDLRTQGVSDERIAVVTKHEPAAAAAASAATGLAAGAGVGALFGLAAVFIPGIGPFITAGFLASSLGAIGGGAAAGAIVGGSAGLVAGALSGAGYATKEAEFLAKELEAGNVLVAVESGAAISDAAVATTFSRYGGRTYATLV